MNLQKQIEILDEMNKMEFKLSQDPTPFEVNQGISIVDGYRSRLAGIVSKSIEWLKDAKIEYKSKYALYLVDTNGRNREERDAMVMNKLKAEYKNFEEANAFHEIAKTRFKAMQEKYEAVSRQITVIELQLKLREITR